MKKYILILWGIIKDFIFNSFWQSWQVLAIFAFSLVINAVLWYIFGTKIKGNSLPFYFASGLIILNLVLANFLWQREKIISYFFLSAGLFIQVLMLILVRYLTLIF